MAFLKRQEVEALLTEYTNIRGDMCSETYWQIKLCLLLFGFIMEPDSIKPTQSHQQQFGGLIMQVFVALREQGAAASHDIPGCDDDKRLCNQDSCFPSFGKVWMFLEDWKSFYVHLHHTYRLSFEVGVDDCSYYYSYRLLMHFVDDDQADEYDFLRAVQYLYNIGFIKHTIAVNLKIGVHKIMNDFDSITEMTHYIQVIRNVYARSPRMTLLETDVSSS